MLIKSFLLASCLLGSGSNLAWAQDDHLVPTNSYFFSYTHEATYYPKVRELLYEGLSTWPLARVVVLPGLTTEYLLALEQEKQQVYLLYRTCKPSIWSTVQGKSSPPPTVETKKVEISPELAMAVAALFNAAIAQTKYPEPEMAMRSDGTTFVFSTFKRGIGLQGGQTWSPTAGTHMADLVAVVEQLQKLATFAADRPALSADIVAQANQLCSLLKPN